MSKIFIDLSEKNQKFIKTNPNIVEELISDYIEQKQDIQTKKELENNSYDFNLNLQLKSVLWI